MLWVSFTVRHIFIEAWPSFHINPPSPSQKPAIKGTELTTVCAINSPNACARIIFVLGDTDCCQYFQQKCGAKYVVHNENPESVKMRGILTKGHTSDWKNDATDVTILLICYLPGWNPPRLLHPKMSPEEMATRRSLHLLGPWTLDLGPTSWITADAEVGTGVSVLTKKTISTAGKNGHLIAKHKRRCFALTTVSWRIAYTAQVCISVSLLLSVN